MAVYSMPTIDYQQAYGQIGSSLSGAIQGIAKIPEVVRVAKLQSNLQELKQHAKNTLQEAMAKDYSNDKIIASQKQIDLMNDPQEITDKMATFGTLLTEYKGKYQPAGVVSKPEFNVRPDLYQTQWEKELKTKQDAAIAQSQKGVQIPSEAGPVPQQGIGDFSAPMSGPGSLTTEGQMTQPFTQKPRTLEEGMGSVSPQLGITREQYGKSTGLPSTEEYLSKAQQGRKTKRDEWNKNLQILSTIDDGAAIQTVGTGAQKDAEELKDKNSGLNQLKKMMMKVTDTPSGVPDQKVNQKAISLGIDPNMLSPDKIDEEIRQNDLDIIMAQQLEKTSQDRYKEWLKNEQAKRETERAEAQKKVADAQRTTRTTQTPVSNDDYFKLEQVLNAAEDNASRFLLSNNAAAADSPQAKRAQERVDVLRMQKKLVDTVKDLDIVQAGQMAQSWQPYVAIGPDPNALGAGEFSLSESDANNSPLVYDRAGNLKLNMSSTHPQFSGDKILFALRSGVTPQTLIQQIKNRISMSSSSGRSASAPSPFSPSTQDATGTPNSQQNPTPTPSPSFSPAHVQRIY